MELSTEELLSAGSTRRPIARVSDTATVAFIVPLFAFTCFVRAGATGATGEYVWSCDGHQSEQAQCGGPSCQSCQPVDCSFSLWSDWSVLGDCTGLCERRRNIMTSNNECGVPCRGVQVETVNRHNCFASNCTSGSDRAAKCEWQAWQAWNMDACVNELGQAYRTRLSTGKHRGVICNDISNETKPCIGEFTAANCFFSDWGDWGKCSKSCGGGCRVRAREIATPARLGGRPCEGALRKTQGCESQPCSSMGACVLSQWSPWTGCTSASPVQRFRSRTVVTPAGQDGHCLGSTFETTSCKEKSLEAGKPKDCVLSAWSEWSKCSRTCGGSSIERSRFVQLPASDGGICPQAGLQELSVCATAACKVKLPTDADCLLSEWSSWGVCTATCGTGIQTRSRDVVRHASFGGKACVSEEMRSVQACLQQECLRTDCKLGEWAAWSACTCTCGGGTATRSRQIVVEPIFGGALCDPVDFAEVTPCNTQSCQQCVDGQWEAWSVWSSCSATCGSSLKSRHRRMLRSPSACGRPVSGLMDEFELCTDLPSCSLRRDCQVSEWGEWSNCDSKCFGVRSRSRTVVQIPSLGGKQCDFEMSILQSCAPAPGEKLSEECGGSTIEPSPCELGTWSDWSACTASCGGGQQLRSRDILKPSHAGAPCNGTTEATIACNTEACDTNSQDCAWGAWSAWSSCEACSVQRYRRRSITTLTHKGGKVCESGNSEETSSCPPDTACEKTRFCVWSAWSSFTPCSTSCGPATSMRQRQLTAMKALSPGMNASDVFLVIADVDPCVGSQIDSQACENILCNSVCSPVDCAFQAWSDWVRQSSGAGICERRRDMSTPSSCGGKLCDGELIETTRCTPKAPKSVDCVLSSWSDWTKCDWEHRQQAKLQQRERKRTVLIPSENGGQLCDGNLQETHPCSFFEVRDCEFSVWSDWLACPLVTCETSNNVVTTRLRHVEKQLVGGGKACTGALMQVNKCASPAGCDTVPCVMGAWADWSFCGADGQKQRARSVLQAGHVGDQACSGSLLMIEACGPISSDCELSSWTEWTSCDKSCGGGQQERQRSVTKDPNSGGAVCEEVLQETRGCSTAPCSTSESCEMGAWSEWSGCTATCGSYQQLRSREFLHLASGRGKRCTQVMKEVSACPGLKPCPLRGCKWSDWSPWSGCSCSCGGGDRTRSRTIVQMPEPGGVACEPLDREVVEPCNTQACFKPECLDAKWGSWGSWQDCSRSCQGGLTWRVRKIAQEPNMCGKSLVGLSRQFSSCKSFVQCAPKVDCELSAWSAWSSCSSVCTGVMRRQRAIVTQRQAGGIPCKAALRQTVPCMGPAKVLSMRDEQELRLTEFSDPKMYLILDNVTHNNLGGKGPGKTLPESLLFHNVDGFSQRPIDLEVFVPDFGNYPGSIYAFKNGLWSGAAHVGNVNIFGQQSMILGLRFVDAETQKPVVMDKFYFRVLDFDKWATGGAEQLVIGGFKSADVGSDVILSNFTEPLPEGFPMPASIAQCTLLGDVDDNPTTALTLTEAQERRSATFYFEKTSSIFLKFVNNPLVDRQVIFTGKICQSCFSPNASTIDMNGRPLPKTACDQKLNSDCEFSDWTAWGPCSSPCGGGQQDRSRAVLKETVGDGKLCTASLGETQPCNQQDCAKDCVKVDCLWSTWTEWSGCMKCSGQKRRSRHVISGPECGGESCLEQAAEEIGSCRRSCTPQLFCAWLEWQPWSACSADCGRGAKYRTRVLSSSSPLAEFAGEQISKYDASSRMPSTTTGAMRVQDIALSFGFGCVSIIAVLWVRRAMALGTERRLREISTSDGPLLLHRRSDGEDRLDVAIE
eukprot:TRINITY_DN67482_c0_g1_i1.p1 TRINITY_DN67482_c0_g1~~TRINITY_DN67482_c0_g1_i1.p1  ORF type:complete len:1818 (-),score=190.99 TRINITY_DN67482_c0_g1_i1:76-5529(-)